MAHLQPDESEPRERMSAMCEFKSEEHRMTQADVRRIARGIVWNHPAAHIAEDAEGIVSVVLANDPMRSWDGVDRDGMYWQPDTSYAYADRHLVTDAQFARIVAETDKQAQRVSKLLSHPTSVLS